MDISPRDEQDYQGRSEHGIQMHSSSEERSGRETRSSWANSSKNRHRNKKSLTRRYAGVTSLAAIAGLGAGVGLSLLLLSGAMDPLSHVLKQTLHFFK